MRPAPFQPFSDSDLHARLFPGDILCVAGVSWVSRRIMRRTTSRGEEPSQISHVGLVTSEGTIRTATVTEAAGGKVRQARIGEVYTGGQGLAIMRPVNIPGPELAAIVANMIAQVGERYGYGDILLHLFATVPGLRWTRRLVSDERPICSQALDRAFRPLGYSFGVREPNPDDIWDFGVACAGSRYAWPFGAGKLCSIPEAESPT